LGFFLLVDFFGLADFVVFQVIQIRRTSSIHVGITECCIQTVLRRLRELLILDWDFGLQASNRDPNSMGRDLFWFELQVVGILQTFYSQAVMQRTTVVFPAFLEHGSAEMVPFVHIQTVIQTSRRIRCIFV
jgi:hypothetical protein